MVYIALYFLIAISDQEVLSTGKHDILPSSSRQSSASHLHCRKQLLQNTTRGDAHCIDLQVWSRSSNQNDVLKPSIHSSGSEMLLDKVVVSLSHLTFTGLVYTSNDQHVVHKTDIVPLALWQCDAFILYASETIQTCLTHRQTKARQTTLCFGSLCSSFSDRPGCSIPATRNAAINILLSKLWELEPQEIPKCCVVELRSRACWP